MQAADINVIKEIPGYKIIMKAVLKSQIQQLVEQLADTTGEESILLTASVSDGTLSHLGSESGKVFLDGHDDIKSQFLGFILKKHHRKKQTEKQFASGPGRRATAVIMPSVLDIEQEMTYSQASVHTESEPQFLPEPILSPPSQTDIHPVSIIRASDQISPKGAVSNIRHEPYPAGRPRRGGPRKGQGVKQTQRSDTDLGHLVKLEINSDSEQSDSAVKTKDTPSAISIQSAPGSIASPVLKVSATSEQFESKRGDTSRAERLDSDFANVAGLSTDTVGSYTNLNVACDSKFPELDESIIVKLEAESEMDLVLTGVEPGASDKNDKEDPDWVPANKRRRSSGSRSVTSRGDSTLNQSGQGQSTHHSVGRKSPSRQGPFKCEICGMICVYRSVLEVHHCVHTGEKPYQCDICICY